MVENLLNTTAAVMYGRTMLQGSGIIGGTREVFVPRVCVLNDQVFPQTGGIIKNPFKTGGKMYTGDLVEYHWNGNGVANSHENAEVILLKVFEVQATVEAEGTTVFVKRDGFRHKPCVGDILMKAPETFDATDTAATVTAVEVTTNEQKNVWKLTLSAAIGALAADDVLVEAAEAGSGKKMLVQNPNAVLPCDLDLKYRPATGEEDEEGATYMVTPALHATMYTYLMSPIPPAVKTINKSRIDGWFEI